ncbi:MAG TPA: 16S rRNA (guanine(966)-N(2))-methyltransferase RsmD [Myxococcota bacterium]|nr:16S rRNA (guanine(966)-N(2))-methyltransferase RsmD [Myxococcota bacterium]
MRVIAGTARGRKLHSPKGLTTRPTPARVREALFSILAAHVPRARVLDLFAGSGALGIEALSRGAARATFVEVDRTTVGFLRRNLATFAERSEILAMPAASAMTRLAGRATPFDLVFLDPPYAQGLWGSTLLRLREHALLAPGAVVVCEHPSRVALVAPAGLELVRHRAFGDVAISLFATPEGSAP